MGFGLSQQSDLPEPQSYRDGRMKVQDFENVVCDFMLQFSGVADAILKSTTFTDGIMRQMQNSFLVIIVRQWSNV